MLMASHVQVVSVPVLHLSEILLDPDPTDKRDGKGVDNLHTNQLTSKKITMFLSFCHETRKSLDQAVHEVCLHQIYELE